MPGPTSSRWRLLRSAAFAAVATELAALGHLVAGGGAPDLSVLLLGAAGVTATTTGLTRRRRGWPTIFGVLAACQLAFHLLFSIDVSGMTAAGPMMATSSIRMLVFHLIAAALSALVLARGEAAVFRLFAALRRSVQLTAAPQPVGLPPRWTAHFGALFGSRPVGALLSTSPRRGPPALG